MAPSPNRTSTVFFDLGLRAGCGTVFAITALLGLTGNVVTCFYLKGRKKSNLRSSLMFVAACHLVHIFVCLPDLYELVSLKTYKVPSVICKTNRYLQVATLYSAVLAEVCICVERYLTTCHPFKTLVMNMRRFTAASLSAAILVAFAFAIPAYTKNTLLRGHCRSKPYRYQKLYKFAEFLLFYLFPVLVFSIMYTKTVRVLWKSTSKAAGSSRIHRRSKPGQKRMAVIKSLIACVVMYIICYSPIQYIYFSTLMPAVLPYPNLLLSMVFIAMTYFSAAVNPMIYFIFIPAFRRIVLRLVCPCAPMQPVNRPIETTVRYFRKVSASGAPLCQPVCENDRLQPTNINRRLDIELTSTGTNHDTRYQTIRLGHSTVDMHDMPDS